MLYSLKKLTLKLKKIQFKQPDLPFLPTQFFATRKPVKAWLPECEDHSNILIINHFQVTSRLVLFQEYWLECLLTTSVAQVLPEEVLKSYHKFDKNSQKYNL